jgi:hypothetical protein
MANPSAPVDGGTRRIPFLMDPDDPGNAGLPMGEGRVSMGAGRTDGLVQAVSPWVRTSNGMVRGYAPDVFKVFDLTAVTTEQLIWTPASGFKFRVLGIHLKASVETKVALIDGTGGSVIFRIGAGDSVPISIGHDIFGPIGLLSGAADRALYLTSSASADLAGTVMGIEET